MLRINELPLAGRVDRRSFYFRDRASRGTRTYSLPHRLVQKFEENFAKHKAVALAAENVCFAVPSERDRLLEMIRGLETNPMRVDLLDATTGSARVFLSRHGQGGEFCTVELKLDVPGAFAECSCGKPRVETKLCVHAVAALLKAGRRPSNYVHRRDQSATWRRQYLAAGAFGSPSPPPVGSGTTPTFLAPLAHSAGKGRKPDKRGLGAQDYAVAAAKRAARARGRARARVTTTTTTSGRHPRRRRGKTSSAPCAASP